MSNTEFVDETGATRLRGQLKPPPASSPVQAVYAGNIVNVADNATGILTWDTLASGTELFDRSNLVAPAFLTAGAYAITVVAECQQALTAAGNASFFLSNSAAAGQAIFTRSTLPFGGVILSQVQIFAAGDTLQLSVTNNDGAVARDFDISGAIVVKL